MKISRVGSRTDLTRFLDFPYHLYQEDPTWIPPLRREVRRQFDPRHNPFLDHCEVSLFLLSEGRQILGRIAAFIDQLAVDAWAERIGLFGYYESVPDQEASTALLNAAETWLRERGMQAMRGPWSFVSQEWGMVVEGFSPPPVIMGPYNPPYYCDQMAAGDLKKAKDLLCYYISGEEGYQIPERILTHTDRVTARYGITIRPLNMRDFNREVQLLLDLSNASIIDNWGYSPVTEAEAEAMARDLKQIIQPEGVLFAENSQGNVVGFAIALPDLNALLHGLNGRLFPLGWLKILRGLPRLNRYRMFGLGVIPEYHGKGIDALIYRALYESLFSPEMWMEINYVLEDNVPMNNAIQKLMAKPLRRYRVYQKAI